MKTKYNYTVELITDHVKNTRNIAELVRSLNFPLYGSLQIRIKKFIQENNIDISHFTGHAWNKGKMFLDDNRMSRKNPKKIFVINSEFSKPYIRKVVLNKKLIKYNCYICKNGGVWLNKKLNLQLDHINGVSTDQRLENLRWLCPNCHSQTDTYGGKNPKNLGKRKVSDEEILQSLKKHKTIHKCLKNLGIENGRNYNRVYKIMEKYGYMMKLENITDSKSVGESLGGSSPSVATTF